MNAIMSVEDRDIAWVLLEQDAGPEGLAGLEGEPVTIELHSGLGVEDLRAGSIDGGETELYWVQHFKPGKITVHRAWDEVEAIPGIHEGPDDPCAIPSGIICASRAEYVARLNGTWEEE